ATASALLRIGDRDHLSVIGGFRPGNEPFGAIDDIVIAVSDGAGLHPRPITPPIGFGLGETNPLLTPNHRPEKPLFLLFVSVKQPRASLRSKDRRLTKRDGDGPRDLFHDHATAHEIEPGAAVFCRDIEQPKTDSLGLLLKRFYKLLRHVFTLRAAFPLQRNQL